MKEKAEPSELMLELGAKLYPKRYRRFKNLRPMDEVCEWARSLDWRNNPYDRFLLKRELLRHIEADGMHDPFRNVYRYASRQEVAAEVDRLLDEFPAERERIGIFMYVLTKIPWDLAFKHGRIIYSPILAALNKVKTKRTD